MPESKEQLKERLTQRSYKIAALLVVYFVATAFLGVVIGRFLDSQFNIKPYGTLGTLLVFYLVSSGLARVFLIKTKQIK